MTKRRQKSLRRTREYNKLHKTLREIKQFEGTPDMESWNAEFEKEFGDNWSEGLTKQEAADFKRMWLKASKNTSQNYRPALSSFKKRLTPKAKRSYLKHIELTSEGKASPEYVDSLINEIINAVGYDNMDGFKPFIDYLQANRYNMKSKIIYTALQACYQNQQHQEDYEELHDQLEEILGVIGGWHIER